MLRRFEILLTESILCSCALAAPAGAQNSRAVTDLDRDGWTPANGDCQELATERNPFPERVNPGAYDVAGNGIDDDCNGLVDDTPSFCGFPTNIFPTGQDLGQALDVCRTTTVASRRWGLVSAEIRGADGTSTPHPTQTAVLAQFGTHLFAPGGFSMAVLSTGTARDQNDPGFVQPGPCDSGCARVGSGRNFASAAPMPAAWLAGRGGVPAYHPTCPQPQCCTAYDSVMLRLRMRVPTNATALRFYHAFFTAEWPNNCNAWGVDTALALVVEGAAPQIPADGNVMLDSFGNPVTAQTAVYEFCSMPPCSGNSALQGTGFDEGCDAATAWQQSVVPIIPGAVMTIEFHLFDGADGFCDSTLLLDQLTWDLLP